MQPFFTPGVPKQDEEVEQFLDSFLCSSVAGFDIKSFVSIGQGRLVKPDGPEADEMKSVMSEKLEHDGHRARLRERFLAGDAGSRSDEALLELLLTYAIPQRDVQPLAKTLIGKFGSLENVLAAPPAELCRTDGLKQTSIVLLKAAHELLAREGRAKALPKVQPASQDKAKPETAAQQELMPQVLSPIEDRAHKTQTVSSRCLLYTSPSPRDGLLSRMPSSA